MTSAEFFRARLSEHIAAELRICRRGAMTAGEPWRLADIGCGYGYWLEYFEGWTGIQDGLYGVDHDWERLKGARERAKTANIVAADTRDLPWESASFDLVTQFVVLTSILERADRQRIASEMLRVLKPMGRILWYDFFSPNPFNRQTRPVRRKEIGTLFPNCRIRVRRVTLAPPLARLCIRLSEKLAQALDRMPFLCTHYLAVIEPVLEDL